MTELEKAATEFANSIKNQTFNDDPQNFKKQLAANMRYEGFLMGAQWIIERAAVLAETIEGADLLCNFTYDVWTCSRYNDSLSWIAVGSFGFADKEHSFASSLAVPTILY